MGLWEELEWRGLIEQSTDREALKLHLESGPIAVYCGFDPTAPSLHHGHLVQLVLLRHFQRAGHRVIGLVGGGTGLIGDPRMSGERVLNDEATVTAWTERLRRQIGRFLSFEGSNPAVLVNNFDWLSEMGALALLRDTGKHFRLGSMLAKETVARRLRSEEGISFTEFAYQILQSVDFLELNRRYGCTLQTGGNDQWGNLMSGVELVRRVERSRVHALTTPLITKSDGTKFGKTEGGAVWLDADHLAPFAFYQFWLNTDDADVVRYLTVLTFRSREELESLANDVIEKPSSRRAQRALAHDLTALVHGDEETARVERASSALFGSGDIRDLDSATLYAAISSLPRASLILGGTTIADLLVTTGLTTSRGAARRAISQGGVTANGLRVMDSEAVITKEHLLHGRWVLVRRGKREYAAGEVDTPVVTGSWRPADEEDRAKLHRD